MTAKSRQGLQRAKTRQAEAVISHVFDPRRGDVAFKVERQDFSAEFAAPQRCNCFTVLWVREGRGSLHADLLEEKFAAPCLLFLNPYQTFFIAAAAPVHGVSLQFHANFFCIETYHEAVGCNGVLFNDIYGRPQVRLDDQHAAEFDGLVAQMEDEMRHSGLAHAEALVSFLKLFLIKATRLKLAQQSLPATVVPSSGKPQVLERLTELIEKDFKTKHGPADYAAALHMTPKALGKLVKAHFGRTLTELIRERLLKHAKWQMLHTQRSVKEVAWEVGFEDEYYFSRLFKQATGSSPTAFRAFEMAIRTTGNLSI